jgi:hypothetical protein
VRDGVAAENDAGFYLDGSQRIELPVRMIAIGKTMEVRR